MRTITLFYATFSSPNVYSQMFSDVSVIACKAATAVHDKMKLLSSDSIIIGQCILS